MVRSGDLVETFTERRLNAALSWLLALFVLAVVVESLLDRDPPWALFAAVVAALALVPAVAYRSPWAMVPWEVLLLAMLPILGRALATGPLTSRLTTYLSVAALALIVAVELHAFTSVRMNHTFAVFVVAITTMASAGIWSLLQWLSDRYLGTAFLPSNAHVMWGFVYAAIAGVLAGFVFDLYFRHVVSTERYRPDEPETREESA